MSSEDEEIDGSMNRRNKQKDWEGVELEGGRLLTSGDDSRRSMETEAQHVRAFTRLFTLTQILGVFILILMVVWLSVFRGGFAWHSNPQLEFNWHPLLMVMSMVFLYSNGALVYRAFRNETKKKLKLTHAIIQIVALILAVIGLQAVFDSHNLNVDAKGEPSPMANLYSLHSWMGLTVVILFACQWTAGLVTFLFPGLRQSLRSAILPVHQFFGAAIFVGAVATALIGLNEKAIFTLGGNYSMKIPEGIMMNSIGLLLALFCGTVIYLVRNQLFRRRATEDEVLLSDTVLE